MSFLDTYRKPDNVDPMHKYTANIFNFVNHRFPDTLYHSSGVRKRDKIKILSPRHQNERSILQSISLSTQVVEAGVLVTVPYPTFGLDTVCLWDWPPILS